MKELFTHTHTADYTNIRGDFLNDLSIIDDFLQRTTARKRVIVGYKTTAYGRFDVAVVSLAQSRHLFTTKRDRISSRLCLERTKFESSVFECHAGDHLNHASHKGQQTCCFAVSHIVQNQLKERGTDSHATLSDDGILERN